MAKERWVSKGREGWLKRDGSLREGRVAKERWVAKGGKGD
jgi:hypothetical protein